MPFLSAALDRVKPSATIAVTDKARALKAAGRNVIGLGAGEPDFDTPANIIEAGANALRTGWTHYGPAGGQPDFRTAIANYLNTARGTNYDLSNIVVTPGGKPIMFFVILALLEAGDEAIYRTPASRSTNR